jgi:hypothetical protein
MEPKKTLDIYLHIFFLFNLRVKPVEQVQLYKHRYVEKFEQNPIADYKLEHNGICENEKRWNADEIFWKNINKMNL